MKKIMLIILISSLSTVCHAQEVTVSSAAADAGVELAKEQIDAIEADKSNQKNYIIEAHARILRIESTEQPTQGYLLGLAQQSPPLQSAVNLCNSNPDAYCPGWQVSDNSSN